MLKYYFALTDLVSLDFKLEALFISSVSISSFTLELEITPSKYLLVIAIVRLSKLPNVLAKSAFVRAINASSLKLPSLPNETSLKA